MARVVTPRGSVDEARISALKDLGTAIGERPFDLQRVEKASKAILEKYGEGTMVEACAAAGAFELNTKCADCTGRRPQGPGMYAIMYRLFSCVRYINELFL